VECEILETVVDERINDEEVEREDELVVDITKSP
jgi:hypothetical protein